MAQKPPFWAAIPLPRAGCIDCTGSRHPTRHEHEHPPGARRGVPDDSADRVERRHPPFERAGRDAGAASATEPRAKPSRARLRADVAAMQAFRPGYPFWRHVFTIPDGSIAFGSAVDGRLLATFPAKGDWSRKAVWTDPAIARTLDGQSLARKLSERREQVALLMERAAGPVLHNSTRGDALLMNAPRYGRFLARMGRHLRAVRRARRHRPGPGHPRIGPERHEALERQCRRLLPVAAKELEATELLLADPDPRNRTRRRRRPIAPRTCRCSPRSTDRSSPRSPSTTPAARTSGAR